MYSQQTYFNKYWHQHGDENINACEKHDGYYYVAGNNTFVLNGKNIFGITMEKLDSLGNSLKYKEIYDTSKAIVKSYYPNSLVKSNTGSFYRVGYYGTFKNNKQQFSGYLYKTNTNLDSIFFKTYPPDTGKARVFEAALYYNHHIYVVGTDSVAGKSYQIMLLKLDTLGNIVWEKKYVSPGSGMIGTSGGYCITKTTDNGIAILGNYNKNISLGGPNDLRVLKLDSNGNQQWARNIYRDVVSGNNDHSIPSIIYSTSEGYILAGGIIAETSNYQKFNLLKLDLQNTLLWRKKHSFLSDIVDVSAITEDKYGNYDILMNESFLNSHLLKVSPTGDSLRMTDFGSINNRAYFTTQNSKSSTVGNMLIKESDKGYTVFGVYFDANGIGDNWVSRIDSNGCNLHGSPYNVTATPIQYNGKSAMKIEWQDSIVNPSRKYSIEARAINTNDYTPGYFGKNNSGLISGYTYIDTLANIFDTIPNIKIHSYRVRAVDSITNNVSCASEMAYILNISKNKELQEIEAKFYPNPAKEFFYVEILNPEKEQITLTIHNLLGEQIQSRQFSTAYLKEQITTKHLSKGIYIVSLQSASGKLLKQSKVVVQ